MDPLSVREQSLATLDELGWRRPPAKYPMLWDGGEIPMRSVEEIQRRVAALNLVLFRAAGCSPQQAIIWLISNGLDEELTADEQPFVEGRAPDVGLLASRVEALWALMWALGPAEHIDPRVPSSEALGSMLPDVAAGEAYDAWLSRIEWTPRPPDEVRDVLDLYFCLHWAVMEASFGSGEMPGTLPPFVIEQRRWALEWCLQPGVEWEAVEMTTR